MSAGTYKITSVQEGRGYSSKYGDMRVWNVSLADAQAESPGGQFELHKKAASRGPEPGDEIEVERFIQGEFQGQPFVRIKQVYNQAGGSSSSTGGGDSKNFDRRPEHPRNEARMIHTSALSAATSYISQMLALGFLEVPKDEDAYWQLVSRVAGRLARSYQGAMAEVKADPSPQPQLNGGEVPADTRELEPAAASKSDEDIPF